MLECDPDWVPSLHLGHTEVIAMECGRFNQCKRRQTVITEDDAAPAALHVAGQDEGATADDGPQMEDAGPNDNTAERLECHLCSCSRAEVDRLLEENRRLKKELAEKNMEEDPFKDDDVKVRYYTLDFRVLCF